MSYARAIDVWYAFCMILVFSTLIEYAFVNSMARAEQMAHSKLHISPHLNSDDMVS